MPSRMPGSASTSTVVNSGTSSPRICTTVAEKPHCGWRRLPFMKSTTRSEAMRESICRRVSSLSMLRSLTATSYGGDAPSDRTQR